MSHQVGGGRGCNEQTSVASLLLILLLLLVVVNAHVLQHAGADMPEPPVAQPWAVGHGTNYRGVFRPASFGNGRFHAQHNVALCKYSFLFLHTPSYKIEDPHGIIVIWQPRQCIPMVSRLLGSSGKGAMTYYPRRIYWRHLDCKVKIDPEGLVVFVLSRDY
jgi:hypothetical protein